MLREDQRRRTIVKGMLRADLKSGDIILESRKWRRRDCQRGIQGGGRSFDSQESRRGIPKSRKEGVCMSG